MAHERICYIHLSIRTTSRRESSMRLNKFAVPSALNYVSEDRINQFKTSETVARHTVIRRIDEASLTADTRTQLNDLIDSFGQSVDEMLELFEKKSFRRYCTSNGRGVSPQKLRNRLVRDRNAAMKNDPVSQDAPLELRPLQNKHWKCVLLHAADIALGYWISAQARTLIKLREKPFFSTLNDEEKHYVNYLLCRPHNDFFDLLEHKIPAAESSKFKKVRNKARLCSKIRTEFVAQAGAFPRLHGRTYCLFDSRDLFSFGTGSDKVQRVKLIGKIAGKRIKIDLLGKGAMDQTVRLVRKDGVMTLHTAPKIHHLALKGLPPKQSGCFFCHSFDMGRTECFVSDTGRSYGDKLGEWLNAYGDWLTETLKVRNPYTAKMTSAESSAKRISISENNLGKEQWNAQTRHFRAEIEKVVNQAINEMIANEPAQVYILEAFSNSWDLSRFSPKVRRMLSGWVRGLIAERMEYKTSVYGIKLVYVTAAYSSQRCPECSYTDPKNRSGDSFHCLACGYTDHADHVGAVNLLLAAHDPSFAAFMSKDMVREFYRAEYEEGCRNNGTDALPVPQRTAHKPTKSRRKTQRDTSGASAREKAETAQNNGGHTAKTNCGTV